MIYRCRNRCDLIVLTVLCPSGAVTRTAARSFAVALFFPGILESFFTSFLCIGIAIINSLVLIAYAKKLKRTPFFGNITVAYLSASIFLFGGALDGWEGIVHIVPIAAITFFAMLSRELVKDAEDVKGDRAGGADTVPIRLALKKRHISLFLHSNCSPHRLCAVFLVGNMVSYRRS